MQKKTLEQKVKELTESLNCYKKYAKDFYKSQEERVRLLRQENMVLKYQVKELAQMLACHSDPQPGE